VALYDASPRHRGLAPQAWEPAWLARRLPAAPARVLVGGCGAGRELLALQAAGFAVDAFDPAPALGALARRRAGTRVGVFRYEELARAVLDGDGPAAAWAEERYEAVLLGWGSLSHVLERGEQARLVRALDRLCPRGPILASFWSCDEMPHPATRAERQGQAIGRRVAALRGLAGAAGTAQAFLLDAGFLHRFSRGEIEGLASAVEREVIWEEDGGFVHVTFCRS
jgi:hypothetical protein